MHAFTLLPHSHKSTGIFNPYWPGRDKTSLGDGNTNSLRPEEQPQLFLFSVSFTIVCSSFPVESRASALSVSSVR